MALPNPNFPLVLWEADFTKGPPNTVGPSRKSLNSAARRTTVRGADITRGRQYELDQTQAGIASIRITDPLEMLHPDNAGSPFNTGGNAIKPYRALRVAAVWPTAPGSGNLINTTFDSTYDPSFETTTGGWAIAGGTTTLAVSAAQFFAGTKSMLVTQSATGVGFGAVQRFPTGPTVTYTFSAYVYPQTGVTVQMQVVDASGATTSSATATTAGAWTRLSLTWTSVDTLETITIFGTGTATPTFYVDATQLEFGSSPTVFTTTGPTQYQQFNSYIERYPLEWDMGGHRGQRPLTAVDGLAVLSRTVITQSYSATILADSPSLYIPYKDTATPHQVLRPTGGQTMLGYIQLGSNSGAVNFGGDQFPDGQPAVTIVQQNTSPPSTGDTTQVTWIGTRGGALTMDPQNFSLEVWLKPVSGALYLGAGAMQTGETTVGKVDGTIKYVGWYSTSSGLGMIFNDPNGTNNGVFTLASLGIPASVWNGFPDGQWHHLVMVFKPTNGFTVYVDGNAGGNFSTITPSVAVSLDNWFADATTTFPDPLASMAISNWAAYTFTLSAGQVTSHYQRGIGYQGEKSGARVTRLLNQYWAGAFTAATGSAAMAPDYAYQGRTMLDVLQEIQETERGLLYVNRSGTVTFEDRSSRYANQTALWVLGENPPGASPTEYPYIAYKANFDPTYTFSQTNLSRPGNTTVTPQINTAAATDYGQRVISQTVQVNTNYDVQQASAFYLNRYSKPVTRIEILTLDPAANPALWPLVLGLEISQRITVKRRTAALTTSADYYVEQISHKIDAQTGAWKTDIQCSPVFVPTAWVLGDATYGVLGTTTVPVY
jgi:hypothetical protein